MAETICFRPRALVRLQCTGMSTAFNRFLPSLTVNRSRMDTGVRSYSVKYRLLQRSTAWCSSQQHTEAGVCSEHCRQDCSAGAKAIRLQASTASAALHGYQSDSGSLGLC